jgi:excisionase family DNA binding protein
METKDRRIIAAAVLLDVDPDKLEEALKSIATPAEKPTLYLVHPDEAAKRLGVCRATVIRGLRDGTMPGRKIGCQWRVDLNALTSEG